MGPNVRAVPTAAKEDCICTMTTYRTIQGDAWDSIAFKLTGDESFATALIQANIEHYETIIFSAGILLNVPEYSAAAASTLPPWRSESDGA